MQCYDADKVCESPVEPSGKNHEIEPERSRATAQAHLSGPSPQTLAGSSRKRGRPPVELSPRQIAENKAAEAKSTYLEAKSKLHEHVNELRMAGAWFDAPSVVARLDERLDTKCRKVVDSQLKSVIGREDGNVYEHIYAEARMNPLNQEPGDQEEPPASRAPLS